MDQGTHIDYALLNELEDEFIAALPKRIMGALKDLEHSLAGYLVNRLEHSLQSKTCAKRDGADIGMIVAALIHDLSNDLAPLTIYNLRRLLSDPICEAKSPGSLNTMVLFRCVTMVTRWVLIKTPVKSTAVINGFTAVKNFANVRIRRHLTLIIPAIHLDILNR